MKQDAEDEFITLKECEEITGFTGSGLRGRKDFPRAVGKRVVYHNTLYGQAKAQHNLYIKSEVLEWTKTHPKQRQRRL